MQATIGKGQLGTKLLEWFAPFFAACCILGCLVGVQAVISVQSAIRSMSDVASSDNITVVASDADASTSDSTTLRDILAIASERDSRGEAGDVVEAGAAVQSAPGPFSFPSSFSEIEDQFVSFVQPFVESALVAGGDLVIGSGLYDPEGPNGQLLDLIIIGFVGFAFVAWLTRE